MSILTVFMALSIVGAKYDVVVFDLDHTIFVRHVYAEFMDMRKSFFIN